MESIKTLKNEFLKQKQAIESKSGVVNVANINPSPSEITAGIETIPSVDLSGSTATEADVLQGKTFYSGNAILKTGTGNFDTLVNQALFLAEKNITIYDDEIYFSLPAGIKALQKYCFADNNHKVKFFFNDTLTLVDEYTFYRTKNFTFENFNDLTTLTKIGIYGFAESGSGGIDFENLPSSITYLGSYAFYNAVPAYSRIRFPENIQTLGQYIFMSSLRKNQESIDLSSFRLNTLTAYSTYGQAFNCDFSIPKNVTSVGLYFNYNGCFHNITIPSGTSLSNYCFGATSSMAASDLYLKTVTFVGENPSSIGTSCFATQNITNGFKIYVPDNSVEAYKNVTNLKPYIDCIYPVSEKE